MEQIEYLKNRIQLLRGHIERLDRDLKKLGSPSPSTEEHITALKYGKLSAIRQLEQLERKLAVQPTSA